MSRFVDLLVDLKLQIDGYGTNMQRLVSNSIGLNTRFHDLVKEQRIGTQKQDRIIKELSEHVEDLKDIVKKQGTMIKELEQRLGVATGRG